MTTNETSWYRDVKPFDALRTQVLPDLIARRASTRSLVIWSLACSTGQEAYGVAMVIRENFPELANWRLEIIGGDISTSVLEQAKSGRYSQLEVNRGLPVSLLVRYFDREGMFYRIKQEIRQRVTFREMNLAGAWPILPRPDIVFLRNVMIYLDLPTRRGILSNVSKNMAPDGYLFLGAGESTLNLDNSFRRVDNDRAGCFQLHDTSLRSATRGRDTMTSGEHDLLATEDILTLTQEVWASILDIPIEITQPSSLTGLVLVHGAVEIDGPWSGTVTVACSQRLATMITAQMFEVDQAEASHDDIVDAVGEIANMIGGNVKALLPGPSTLSLPSVHVDHVAPPDSGDTPVTSWGFVTDGERFVVTVSATPTAHSNTSNNDDGAPE